ncbi:MAG: S-methyl-5-thioribose-1-phosphate isomerase [Candidatus Methanarcanum hacksteinii]|uniref:S-methyl-5-thioribose-1-phosphate isomerase n=1 Tax=Candidatus Methanarcanum hacksteinii TaxID=2911857 RepID=UPI0026F87D82|nr:S-methyl-5-thioribose-1-phosphate isomerase [Methanomassiliicoccales archaeon]MDO5837350.1 S-methyl-5-thioribose-1-phosphate isomerase [Methanomassiliicoccales archaeon]MDY4580391.1 S-methyl-5-thioribose-1-phosphate isomerase [Candidatus Methanarcanum hacksteinii]
MKANINGRTEDIRAVWFEDGKVTMIDQRELPDKVTIVSFKDYRDVAEAIRNMTTRGAPSIGATAAYGMCLAAINGDDIEQAAKDIKAARPTANDLFYAVDYMLDDLSKGKDPIGSADAYAQSMVDKCIKIGEYGGELIKDGYRLMTHCNAGALATVDVGTALAPMRKAHGDGKDFFVYVSETRPRLQGMQLTAWELLQEGIDHAIIPDGSSGHFIRKGVDMIIVGADRIAANGDFANKIGTFEKAVLAKEFNVPFYVAAPISTFDFNTKTGEDIVIEDRSEEEVTMVKGVRIAPIGCKALNPSFDMTPAKYVTGFITEKGILKPSEISKVKE